MAESNIEWTGHTWNPILGCSVVSPGCTNCYAMKMAARLERMGQDRYTGLTKPSKAGAVWAGEMRLVEDALTLPLRRKKPTTYFVNSMSDLFHENVPDAWIDRVFAVMALAPQHTFQVLTKRSARMRAYFAGCENPPDKLPLGKPWVTQWSRREHIATAMEDVAGRRFADRLGRVKRLPLPNVWLGVSCEDQTRADERAPDLLATPAAVRFVSAEPLLGPIDFEAISDADATSADPWPHRVNALTGDVADDANGIIEGVYAPGEAPRLDWIIVGGESGPNARESRVVWGDAIQEQCRAAGVACFRKQLGSRPIADDLTGWSCAAELLPDASGYRLALKSRKGGDWSEWPEAMRVREMPFPSSPLPTPTESEASR